MLRIFNLLGGLFGPDGEADSRGTIDLANHLTPFGTVSNHFWSSASVVSRMIDALKLPIKVVLIGYSGGGSRATWIANDVYPRTVDLMVLYDPSPAWQMKPLQSNVKLVLQYHDLHPLMFGLGGGQVTGHARHVETFQTSDQHLAVQYDQSLHRRTIAAVEELYQQESHAGVRP